MVKGVEGGEEKKKTQRKRERERNMNDATQAGVLELMFWG